MRERMRKRKRKRQRQKGNEMTGKHKRTEVPRRSLAQDTMEINEGDEPREKLEGGFCRSAIKNVFP